MRAAIHHFIDEREYLLRESMASTKSEYFQGEILAMSGGLPRHNELAARITGLLHERLKGSPCRPFSSDQRIWTPGGLYTYPDLSVICGRVQLHEGTVDVATNPIVLVEVLSPGTRAYDRGEKLELYKAIPSLRDVLLVEQDSPHIEHVYRTEHGWEVRIAHGVDAVVRLVGVQAELPLAEVYERGFAEE